MPKSIYLDSNDFSDLSLPGNRLRSEDKAVLNALRAARDSGKAVFFLSPPHLSEAVHATEANKEHALRRAILMGELCGLNALRYPTDISKLELTAALSNSDERVLLQHIKSSDDEWFGMQLASPDLAVRKLETKQKIEQHLQSLPRAKRRKLKSQLNLSKANGRLLFKQRSKQGRWAGSPTEFPFSLLDQDLFLEWFLGEKSDLEIRTHLREILHNPAVVSSMSRMMPISGNSCTGC